MEFSPVILTVNVLLCVAQSFYLGICWERYRLAALAARVAPPPSKENQ